MGKAKLLYIHVGLSSFVKKDIQLLSKEYELEIFHFKLSNKVRLPLSFVEQLFFMLSKTRKSIGIVTQFAGYQSYLPTRLATWYGKKSIIIMGGTDSVSFPSIQYGCFYKRYLRLFTKWSLKRASLLLPVADSIIDCEYTYHDNDYPRQGYRFHAPEIRTEVQTIYNGYDESKWFSSDKKEKNSFLTVAADLGTRFGKKLKGIDLIFDIAPLFPHCTFYIIGGDKLNESLPANVVPVNNMPHEELPTYISGKAFYLQLSISEGFPNALCESMLSGCIPIVSNVGAMPLIVEENGFVLKKKDPTLLADLINRALDSEMTELSSKARNRIAEAFPLKRREKELIKAIQQHISDKNT